MWKFPDMQQRIFRKCTSGMCMVMRVILLAHNLRRQAAARRETMTDAADSAVAMMVGGG